ncbi:MAG: hypothetical protein NTV42_06345 [Chloroflexi bacterium]|nr:hypothetical protein [Chloroflexota bacterium]
MAGDIKVRKNWLKGMYIYTIVVAGLSGLGMLIAPELNRSMLAWPATEPIIYGICGSVYLAFGLLSIFGLRDPLKFSPVLLLQLVYKSIWFIAVVAPLAVAGKFPMYALGFVIIFATFIIGDLIAIPFAYLFAKPTK